MNIERIKKWVKDFLEKIIYVSLINLAFCFGVVIVDSLKLRGVLKEIDLEPFPKNLRGVISANHQDGVEWLFIYRRYFRPLYFIAPWLVLKSLPYTWADRNNFLGSSLTRFLGRIIIPVDRPPDRADRSADRNGNDLAKVSFKKSLAAAKAAGLVVFSEGHRTWKCSSFRYSQKGKPLGELNESLGFFAARGLPIKSVYIEYSKWIEKRIEEPDAYFSSLPVDGEFRVKRFFSWYWRTFLGENGEINIVWGETVKFEIPEGSERKEFREIATRELENRMLELADKV